MIIKTNLYNKETNTGDRKNLNKWQGLSTWFDK